MGTPGHTFVLFLLSILLVELLAMPIGSLDVSWNRNSTESNIGLEHNSSMGLLELLEQYINIPVDSSVHESTLTTTDAPIQTQLECPPTEDSLEDFWINVTCFLLGLFGPFLCHTLYTIAANSFLWVFQTCAVFYVINYTHRLDRRFETFDKYY